MLSAWPKKSVLFYPQRNHKEESAKSEDRVYLPKRKDAVYLTAWPQALRMLQQIRDEAHRLL